MPLGMLGKYERLDVLGHGASGIVYLAKDTLLGKQVALKELSAEGPDKERVLEEARVLDRLRHPNIVRVNGVDEIGGKVVIDMEYIQGRNLQDILRQKGHLLVQDAVGILAQVCDGLAYAHVNRTVHRDIKPANIIVGYDQSVKLVDFGLAEVLGTHSMAGGAGTYAYMAPEDFHEEQQSDRQSDIWAVGVILYETLTGRRPFYVAKAKDPFAWKRAIELDPIVPVTKLQPGIPDALNAIVDRALARSKQDRYNDIAEFAHDLRACGVEPHVPVLERDDAPAPAARLANVMLDDDRTVAGLPNTQIVPGASDIEQFLDAAPDHWVVVRNALLTGALSLWLAQIGEVPLSAVAEHLAAVPGYADDERLREFLYRAGVETTDIAQRSYLNGVRQLQAGDVPGAVQQLLRATRLDPDKPEYFAQLARALNASGDTDGAQSALRHVTPQGAGGRVQPRESGALSLLLSKQTLEFGSIRQGAARTLRLDIRHPAKGLVAGRVVLSPPWVSVVPAVFRSKNKQSLAATILTDNVFEVPRHYRDAVVLETEDGIRHEVFVEADILPKLRTFWQIAFWYLPLLLCCLAPATGAALSPLEIGRRIGDTLAAMVATGLLGGSLFVIMLCAETDLPTRLMPLALIAIGAAGAAGIVTHSGPMQYAAAQVELMRCVPPVLVLLVAQGVALARSPRGWGRWQVWAWLTALAGILAALIAYRGRL